MILCNVRSTIQDVFVFRMFVFRRPINRSHSRFGTCETNALAFILSSHECPHERQSFETTSRAYNTGNGNLWLIYGIPKRRPLREDRLTGWPEPNMKKTMPIPSLCESVQIRFVWSIQTLWQVPSLYLPWHLENLDKGSAHATRHWQRV